MTRIQPLLTAMVLACSANIAFAQSSMTWRTDIGTGFDSNIYKAPSGTYVDHASGGQIVVPKTHSGTFVPALVKVSYRNGALTKNSLLLDYRFSGLYYLDGAFDNANQVNHRLRVGDEFVLRRKKSRKDSVYAGLIVGRHQRLYLDRDSGDDQEFRNSNVSERYVYDNRGVELNACKHTGRVKLDAEITLMDKDYKDTVAISEYDHRYLAVGGAVKFRLAKYTKWQIGYKYSVYDYKERPSRDVLGSLKGAPLKYVYHAVRTGIRQRLLKQWVAYLDYEYKTRSDEYVSYHDYSKDQIRGRVLFNYSKNTRVKLSATFWQRDYPYAFAFDDPTQALKYYEGNNLELSGRFTWIKNRSVDVALAQVDEDSTDLRYKYSRFLARVRLAWEF